MQYVLLLSAAWGFRDGLLGLEGRKQAWGLMQACDSRCWAWELLGWRATVVEMGMGMGGDMSCGGGEVGVGGGWVDVGVGFGSA